VPVKVVPFSDLSWMAVERATAHLPKTHDYVAKDRVPHEPLGSRPAIEVTPPKIAPNEADLVDQIELMVPAQA